MCVLSIRQQDLITSWQRNSLQKQLGCLKRKSTKKPHNLLIFKGELWQSLPLKGLPVWATSSTSLYLISHHNIQELAFLSPWPSSSVEFVSPQGLLLFALKSCWKLSLLENIPVSWWLAIIPTSHSSQPLSLVFTPLAWHPHSTPCPQRSWESCTISSHKGTLRAPKVVGTPHSHHSDPLGDQVQVLQDPLVQQTPLRSHTTY